MDFAAEQTTQRISRSLEQLGDPPHPRDVLRLTLTETLPLHADARATRRMNAAYVLEALHDEEVLARTRDAMAQGRAQTETDLLLALTGFATLIELRVIDPQDVLKAVDQHLDRLFDQ